MGPPQRTQKSWLRHSRMEIVVFTYEQGLFVYLLLALLRNALMTNMDM